MEKGIQETEWRRRIELLLRKNGFDQGDILYITHLRTRTSLRLADGREIETSLPLKYFTLWLPEDDFWNIQKGVLVAGKYVVNIEGRGIYTMIDGQQFTGRGRNPAEHRRRKKLLDVPTAAAREEEYEIPMGLLEKCTVMENAPIAFCVIELVFAPDGRGIDFIFRYCNKAMEPLEGKTVEEMLNHSFYEVFKNGDRKWIVPYADVAINGVTRVLVDYSPEVDKQLTIYCFQPEEGYTACLLTETGRSG